MKRFKLKKETYLVELSKYNFKNGFENFNFFKIAFSIRSEHPNTPSEVIFFQ